MEPGRIIGGMFHVEQIVLPVGEIGNWLVAWLGFCFGKIDDSPQEPGWGSGFKPAQFQAQFLERTGQAHRRSFACPPA